MSRGLHPLPCDRVREWAHMHGLLHPYARPVASVCTVSCMGQSSHLHGLLRPHMHGRLRGPSCAIPPPASSMDMAGFSRAALRWAGTT